MSFGKKILDSLKNGLAGAIGGLPGMAIGFGTSALQGLMGNAFERKSLDYQAQLNEQSALNAYNRQLDFWNKQNEYNSPEAQIARLRKAGLNPALLNGNAVNNTAGGLSSTPQASSGSPSGSKPNASADATALANFAYQVKQMGFLDQQTKEAMQRILSIKVERGIRRLEGEMKLTDAEKAKLDYNEMYEALYGESIDGGAPTIKNNRYTLQIQEARSRIDMNEARKELDQVSKEFTEAQKRYAENRENREAEEHLASLAAIAAQKTAAYAQAAYANAQAKHVSDTNQRESELHAMTIAIEELRKSGIVTENDAKALQLEVEKAWNEGIFGKDAKGHRWHNFERIVNNFFHQNVTLSGSSTVSFQKLGK